MSILYRRRHQPDPIIVQSRTELNHCRARSQCSHQKNHLHVYQKNASFYTNVFLIKQFKAHLVKLLSMPVGMIASILDAIAVGAIKFKDEGVRGRDNKHLIAGIVGRRMSELNFSLLYHQDICSSSDPTRRTKIIKHN